ncbi:DUF3105 domain-containing protein [Actinomadura chibensis]|uniref:DUF3105 domain-containing protein n=1 Tax=Actinomadura chibensis TaxID=392828 RepID=A0A5D0NCK8_9ACTN|nr:DUF3105 domain-containing protein [Actinomadura chibensis]TYB42170.1 DUF3105 domain-containing protein [Actinomadura chibensis]
MPRRPPRPRRPLRLAVIVAGAASIVAGNVVAYRHVSLASEPRIPGVRRYSGLARTHTTRPVVYPQTPPVGGPHAPSPLNCGVYVRPVPVENAVHSMEHGAVWVTYRPDLPAGQVRTLRDLVRGKSFLLLSPYPGLPAPVVASAWGRQLRLPAASDSRLAGFVDAYRRGPQTPERGAPCSGGVGSPLWADRTPPRGGHGHR